MAKRVLPYSNQQVGGALGGPIVRDKLHYFGSYEYEREPSTAVSTPTFLPGQIFSFPSENINHSYFGRVDDQMTTQGPHEPALDAIELRQPFRRHRRRPSSVGGSVQEQARTTCSARGPVCSAQRGRERSARRLQLAFPSAS